MEIEVGEYIKDNKGNIGKVIGIFDGHCTAKYHIEFKGNVKVKRQYLSTNSIVKHSKNIIDLIEVGDILEIKESNDICYLGLKKDTTTVNYADIIEDIKAKKCELLSILTKEQYKQNCYRLEE